MNLIFITVFFSLSFYVHHDVSFLMMITHKTSSSSSIRFCQHLIKELQLTSKSTLFSHFQYHSCFMRCYMQSLRVFNLKKNVTALFLSTSPLLFVPFRSYLFAVITKSNCCRFLLSMIDLRLKVVA